MVLRTQSFLSLSRLFPPSTLSYYVDGMNLNVGGLARQTLKLARTGSLDESIRINFPAVNTSVFSRRSLPSLGRAENTGNARESTLIGVARSLVDVIGAFPDSPSDSLRRTLCISLVRFVFAGSINIYIA